MLQHLTRRDGAPPPVPGPVEQAAQLLRLPLLPLQIFQQNLLAVRPWWPVVLPLLGWAFWRTYERERAEALRARAERVAAERALAAERRRERPSWLRRRRGGAPIAGEPAAERGATDA
jgi:hypothetical protein